MRIKQLGDPILKEVSRPILPSEIASDEIQSLLTKMKAILNGIKSISDENGNALSAPQSGLAVRMILLRIDGKFVPMINPEITEHSTETFAFEEECFSFYNLRATVKRFKQITVTYLDEQGQPHSIQVEGEFAGLIQHEIDHLNGVFFLDRVTPESQLNSVDHLLKDNPQRLKVVQEMMSFMTGQD